MPCNFLGVTRFRSLIWERDAVDGADGYIIEAISLSLALYPLAGVHERSGLASTADLSARRGQAGVGRRRSPSSAREDPRCQRRPRPGSQARRKGRSGKSREVEARAERQGVCLQIGVSVYRTRTDAPGKHIFPAMSQHKASVLGLIFSRDPTLCASVTRFVYICICMSQDLLNVSFHMTFGVTIEAF